MAVVDKTRDDADREDDEAGRRFDDEDEATLPEGMEGATGGLEGEIEVDEVEGEASVSCRIP
jgi:hypothetical protein